ncbi:MAG: SPFH domain-containing protein [Candidatus Diapherotrites archaeon]|uniref:SPFH domain-containing protein n=1 Tax=Candidatus Iainarchaeum sp. TaxID=3101447 RepID=A0A8T3YMZ3_9ARCH|nr:SPFH domain-containing protein [Candidatus Diapherotrites archaeon]
MASHGDSHSGAEGHEGGHSGHGHETDDYRKQGIFLVLVVALAGLAYLIFSGSRLLSPQVTIALLFIVLLAIASRMEYLLKLNDYERAVVFRFGKFNRVGGPGWALVFPPFERHEKVDLRTKTIDIPPQDVVTKDSIELKIDAVIYLKVNKDNASVANSIVEIDDWVKASVLFVKGMIRDKAGGMTLNELVSNVAQLNDALKKELALISTKWGVSVEGAVIEDINIPKTVLDAMHEQKAAIQKKLARIESAQGQQAEIEAVRSAAAQLDDKTLAYYYVKALEKLGEGSSTKIIFPMELTNLARSLTKGNALSHEDLESLFRKYAPIVKSLSGVEKKGGK